jgi:hypothetical protein
MLKKKDINNVVTNSATRPPLLSTKYIEQTHKKIIGIVINSLCILCNLNVKIVNINGKYM